MGYLPKNPARRIPKFKAEKDRRRIRTNFTDEQLAALMRQACASTRQVRGGATGRDRAILYMAAAATGLRQKTLRKLAVNQFALSGAGAGVSIRGDQEKAGKERFVPIRPDVAAVLADYFSSKLPTVPAFKVPRWGIMKAFKADMIAAGVAFSEVIQEEGVRRLTNVRDFHSLRHTFGTRLALAGVPIKVAQVLMGHSDPKLTMMVYSHVQVRDQVAALSMLPPMPTFPAAAG